MYKNAQELADKIVEVVEKYVDSFPVDLRTICNKANVKLRPFSLEDFLKNAKKVEREKNIKIPKSTLIKYINNYDGAIQFKSKSSTIIYKENCFNCEGRKRFTISHELGHKFLNHKDLKISDIKSKNFEVDYLYATIGKYNYYKCSDIDKLNHVMERQANIFAGELMLPAYVIDYFYNEIKKYNNTYKNDYLLNNYKLKYYFQKIFKISSSCSRAKLVSYCNLKDRGVKFNYNKKYVNEMISKLLKEFPEIKDVPKLFYYKAF